MKHLRSCSASANSAIAGQGVRSQPSTPDSRLPIPRTSDSGLTLVELIVVAAILAILAGTAAPIARYRVKSAQETELRTDLRTMRSAIDEYKRAAELGAFSTKLNSFNYPPDLQTLVDGVDCTSGTAGKTTHVQFLRKIPKDPMTGQADWTVRSMADDPGSDSGGGENVFDVHSKSDKTSITGTKYNTW